MSVLETDVCFDFTFPSPSIEEPSTPPSMAYTHFDQTFLELPYAHSAHSTGHARSSSQASSIYSAFSTVESTPDSVCTRLTTPPRASPPVHRHGPLLLPKIRPRDQDIDAANANNAAISVKPVVPRRAHKTASPAPASQRQQQPQSQRPVKSSHVRSYTSPDALGNMAFAHMAPYVSHAEECDTPTASLLCSPASFAHEPQAISNSHHARRASSLDAATIGKYGYPTYRQLPFMPDASSLTPQPQPQQQDFTFPSAYTPREPSPLQMGTGSATPEPVAMPQPITVTTLAAYLSAPNPAASLVRTISFPFRDPNTKHFWWDVRNVRSWNSFNASTIFSLPGVSALMTTPVPTTMLPQTGISSRHPETEAALHSIYASYYLPKLNSALAITSARPLQLSVPSKLPQGMLSNELLFTANVAGDAAAASAMFGGKPTARVVGLVRSFDRFNTGMRVEGNIKRVEYLRGLSALHHAMREHGCRYGFILTEIELVVVRNGTEMTPHFGDIEITSFQLSSSSSSPAPSDAEDDDSPLTACMALWGLCHIANDDSNAYETHRNSQAHWRSEIGAPAEGTRRKARPRDKWMPQPQLAEKREAKRSRGWVWPEDAVGRKELGKRGVRYSGA